MGINIAHASWNLVTAPSMALDSGATVLVSTSGIEIISKSALLNEASIIGMKVMLLVFARVDRLPKVGELSELRLVDDVVIFVRS